MNDRAKTLPPDPLPQDKLAVDTKTNLFDLALWSFENMVLVQNLKGACFEPLNLTIDSPARGNTFAVGQEICFG